MEIVLGVVLMCEELRQRLVWDLHRRLADIAEGELEDLVP